MTGFVIGLVVGALLAFLLVVVVARRHVSRFGRARAAVTADIAARVAALRTASAVRTER